MQFIKQLIELIHNKRSFLKKTLYLPLFLIEI
jgi:hypothetical protein